MAYEVVIGLEVHAELSTKTKIYCGCKNEFGAEPNTNCCPVCMGFPGTLPVLNEAVVAYAAKMGCALNCTIHRFCKQDRKNYFYPDLPKAYQISQFDIPLCENGYLDIVMDDAVRRIGITRIHIEEDAGKLLHDELSDGSLIDYNRCGVPLIEIVTEPDLRSAQEARVFLETIRSTLLYLGISDCKMQEGSIRCDVNVSLREKGDSEYGTRCEMKNVNSFSGAVRAIEYEVKRQTEILNNGGVIEQETRRWDDAKGKSFVMRTKEDAQDYRFFPEPDLPPIVLEESAIDAIRASLPELPNHKFLRYMQEYGFSVVEAGLLTDDPQKAAFFEAAYQEGKCSAKTICNWMLGDLFKEMNDRHCTLADLQIAPCDFATLLSLIERGEISNAAAKKVFEQMLLTHKTPETLVKEMNLTQISDENALISIVKAVLEENQKSVSDYLSGKKNAYGYLVGQCMKKSNGKGNPNKMKEILSRFLEE